MKDINEDFKKQLDQNVEKVHEKLLDKSSIIQELNRQETSVVKKIFELKNRLIEAESRESDMECSLWVNTDFKSLKLTNGDQRKAYVKKEMSKYIKTSSLYKNEINLCENLLKLIRSKKRFLLETDYEVGKYVYYIEMIEELCKNLHIE